MSGLYVSSFSSKDPPKQAKAKAKAAAKADAAPPNPS